MPITTFDTLKFVRRLEQVGVPSEQAEAQAEVLTEAFNVNLEELVTKDYLAAEFAKERAYIDTHFAKERSYMDSRFAEERIHSDRQFAQIDSRLTVQSRMLGIVIAAVLLPLFERLINL